MLSRALAEGQTQMVRMVTQRLNELLVLAVTQLLGRLGYERRAGVPFEWEQSGACRRCQSHQCRRFVRNGYRKRSLLTPVGWLEFWLPRVRCTCGGSVEVDFAGLVRPYQRISDLVDEQVRRWYRIGMSLRQMEHELSQSVIGPASLRTLLKRVHQLTPPVPTTAIPPILQVDAIWVTQVVPNGRMKLDRKGRRRATKSRRKRPIFIALGVWPERDQALVLDWMVGESEDAAEWLRFLTRLEEAGVRGEQGLRLLIHDGGSGLSAALHTVHFGVPYQRCLFHKLRNIAAAIALPTGLTRPQRSRQRKAILQPFRDIWQAKRFDTLLRRYLQVVRAYRQTQPEAVAALRRDFRQTLAFFSLLGHYPAHHLRTTSRLERLNRTVRTRLRLAAALHSDAGLVAMLAQQIHAFNATSISTA
jgi:transposase-like protein